MKHLKMTIQICTMLLMFFACTRTNKVSIINSGPRSNKGPKADLAKPDENKTSPKKKLIKEHPEHNAFKTRPNSRKLSRAVLNYCQKMDRYFKKYRWGKSYCKKFDWHHVRNSWKGDPLIWLTYGSEREHKVSRKDVTMILCGVHGDEITPVKFCFDIIHHLENHRRDFSDDRLVVVAPVVNPDSFFKKRPTRTNYKKVDVNRNFPTKDWKKDAIRMWKHRYSSDKRRYPGRRSLSEPETVFQVNLIKRYDPGKIISVHAPLTIIDYDGPENFALKKDGTTKANQLLIQMSQKAKGYRIKNYPFFPGSLGNWAGNERKIPTYTLELPSSDPHQSKKYWKLFKNAIHSAIILDFRERSDVAKYNDKEQSSKTIEKKLEKSKVQ